MLLIILSVYTVGIVALFLHEPVCDLLSYVQHCKCSICQKKNRLIEMENTEKRKLD